MDTTRTGAASPTLANLAAALSAAQGEIEGAVKGKTNPHFKSAYADLASVWEACRAPLSKHKLSIVQPVSASGPQVTVTTILLHASGEWISADLTMTAQQSTPQAIGSCITYARRYALAAMVGIAPEDDDGNAASQPNGRTSEPVRAAAPAGFDEWLTDLESVADEGTEALKKAWTKSQPFLRKHLTDTQPHKLDELKLKAERSAVPA